MLYLKTRKIDGLDVVTGGSVKSVDPMASQRATIDALKETSQWLDYVSAIDEIEAVQPAIRTDKAGMARWRVQMKAATEKGKRNKAIMDAVHRALAAENIIFFPLAEDEVETTKENLEDVRVALKNLAPGERLLLDGSIVKDRRGQVLYDVAGDKVTIHKITTLGQSVPKTAVAANELSPSDIAVVRRHNRREKITSLSSEEKAIHKKAKLLSLARRLSVDVVAAEIAGETRAKALTATKAEYATQAALIEEDYS